MEGLNNHDIEANEKVNIQCDCDRNRVGGRVGDRRPPCVNDREIVEGVGGIDSSLLFFFLLLVVIVCQFDCDIEMSTLLWFFLLLVVLLNKFDC